MNPTNQTAGTKFIFYDAPFSGVTETKRAYLQAILSELIETEDESLLDLILRVLVKSKKTALHAANMKNGTGRFTAEP